MRWVYVAFAAACGYVSGRYVVMMSHILCSCAFFVVGGFAGGGFYFFLVFGEDSSRLGYRPGHVVAGAVCGRVVAVGAPFSLVHADVVVICYGWEQSF